MIRRQAERTLKILAEGYPVVAITGPRQSGKTTLARLAYPEIPYLTLEDPDIREFVRTDPRTFLGTYQTAIFDEIQRTPELLSYLQGIVDASPTMGRFILTGSQQLGLRSQLSQSLAGRVGQLELAPFCYSEIALDPKAPQSSEEACFMGGYPPLFDRPVRITDWITDYITTYLERDVRQLLMIKDLRTFRVFMGLVAGRSGQPLNYSSLGSDAGISHHTVREWLSILEASYIIKIVEPYHTSFSKRLIKAPMLYFLDSGVLCALLGIRNHVDLQIHPFKGPVFETYVFSEIYKTLKNARAAVDLFFWRDHRGHEVDFLIEDGSRLHLLECKAGRTISESFFDGILKLKAIAGERVASTALIYGGSDPQQRSHSAIVSWRGVGAYVAQVCRLGI